jgi:hypothetical protein
VREGRERADRLTEAQNRPAPARDIAWLAQLIIVEKTMKKSIGLT